MQDIEWNNYMSRLKYCMVGFKVAKDNPPAGRRFACRHQENETEETGRII